MTAADDSREKLDLPKSLAEAIAKYKDAGGDEYYVFSQRDFDRVYLDKLQQAVAKARQQTLNWALGTLEHNSYQDFVKLANMQLDSLRKQQTGKER